MMLKNRPTSPSYHTYDVISSTITTRPRPKQPKKITKKQNARMQLAAALIEADNEAIQRRRTQAQQQLYNHSPSPDQPRPPPPPQPKLASQSVLFAPWRQDEDHTGDNDTADAGSLAPSSAFTRTRSIQRPQSKDFLGVTLPGDSAPAASSSSRSRPSSVLSTAALSAQHTSRPGTPLTTHTATRSRPQTPAGPEEEEEEDGDGDDAQSTHSRLSTWGVDKFLSTDARQDIANHRQRTTSAASAIQTTQDDNDDEEGFSQQHRRTPSHRATSDIVSINKPTKGTNLELLARIKLYRERQENLPPSQWDEVLPQRPASTTTPPPQDPSQVPTPTPGQYTFPPKQDSPASPAPGLQLALGSPIQSPHPAESPRQGKVTSHQATPSNPQSLLNRRESSKGYFGESWSDAGSTLSHAQTNSLDANHRPFHTNKPSSAIGHLAPTAEEETLLDSAVSDDHDDDDDAPIMGMAGVGSYLRSRSRHNSTIDQGPTTATASQDSTYLSTDTRPFRPSPLANPSNDDAVHSSPRFARTPLQAGPASFQATAALQGDFYAALALGNSPYPGSAFQAPATFSRSPTFGNSPVPGRSPTFDQVPLAPAQSSLIRASPSAVFATLPTPSSPPSPELATAASMPAVSASTAGMTTRQLQALARQSQFPDSYGIITPFLMEEAEQEDQYQRQREQAEAAGFSFPNHDDAASLKSLPRDGWVPEKQRGLFSRAWRPSGALAGGAAAIDKLKEDLSKLEPDLSSARWGQNKRRYSTGAFKAFNAKRQKDETSANATTAVPPPDLDTTGHEPEVEASLQIQASDAVTEHISLEPAEQLDLQSSLTPDVDIDDDYISPPRKGPLKPRGIEERLPDTLIMPELLEGSAQQPRTRLTEVEQAAAANAPGRRQSGLYVPDGFVLHDGKALPPIQKVTTSSGKARFSFVFPAAAPDGIGRRAKMPSTALFRNQLVQHEEEQEGWGWEKSTVPTLDEEDEGDVTEPVKLSKKQLRQAKKTATKEAKARYKRKRARALRRKARARAQAEGKTNAHFGVPDESPAEDLSLTEDSVGYTDTEDEDAGWDSDDNKRWVDNQKPVGKLFGKSLMDVADERQAQRHANRRYYGQLEVQEQEAFERASSNGGADGQSVMAPSEAGGRTFRDNPLGYNDTRERMQAAFGVDNNLARELEAKRIRDAQAAEEEAIRRLAQEEYEKEEAERKKRKEEKRNARRIFLKKKNKKQDLAADPISDTASFRGPQDLATASQVDLAAIENVQLHDLDPMAVPPGSPPIPRAPLEAPRLDLGLSDNGHGAISDPRRSKKGIRETAAEWFAPSSSAEESEEESDSEDEATRRKRAMNRARLSRSLGGPGMGKLDLAGTALHGFGHNDGGSSDSDEDEVPLSQLKQRRPLTQLMTNNNNAAQLRNKKSAMAFGDSSDEDEEDVPLDELKRRSVMNKQGGSLAPGAGAGARLVAASDSEEELPLTQLRAKQYQARQSMGTVLNLNLNLPSRESSIHTAAVANATAEDDDSDEDEPIGLRMTADSLAALKNQARHHGDSDDDSDDDKPFGMHHSADVLASLAHQSGHNHSNRCACGRMK